VCCGGYANGTHVMWEIGSLAPGEITSVYYTAAPSSSGDFVFSYFYNGTNGVRSWSLSENYSVSVLSDAAVFDAEIDLDATTPQIERTVPLGVPRIGVLTIKNVGSSEVNSTHPLSYRWVFSKMWKVVPEEGSPCVTISLNSSFSALQCQINYLPPGAKFSVKFSIESKALGYEVTGSKSSWDPPLKFVFSILKILGIL